MLLCLRHRDDQLSSKEERAMPDMVPVAWRMCFASWSLCWNLEQELFGSRRPPCRTASDWDVNPAILTGGGETHDPAASLGQPAETGIHDDDPRDSKLKKRGSVGCC